eukprot:TRINITY_DN40764_c0_g1_i1.p1 TRINITY_DN40764_c0_g1~~TRINITY_DN40764_c0_g1_i1.p1  ORF type:complete len:465 (-),score=126.67 TRINITY_DN40764_c0_g1_i1:112-1506(-)
MAADTEGWCDQCYEKAEKIYRCSQCQAAVYCSQDCQRRAWKCHKTVCKPVPRKKKPSEPAPVRDEAAAEAAAERREADAQFRSELLRATQGAVTAMLAAMQETPDDAGAFLPRVAELRRDFEADVRERLRSREGSTQEPGAPPLDVRAAGLVRDLAKEVLMAMLRRGNSAPVARDLLDIGNNHFRAGLLQRLPTEARALPDDTLDGFERAAAQVLDKGFTCVEGLLDEEIAGVIYEECREKFYNLRGSGAMQPVEGAEAGGGFECHIPYPSRGGISPELDHALRIMFGLPHELARHGYPVPLQVPTMAQLGCLPPRAHEGLHLDNGSPAEGGRELTIVLFCNSNWQPEEEGAFRAYLDGDVPGPRPDSSADADSGGAAGAVQAAAGGAEAGEDSAAGEAVAESPSAEPEGDDAASPSGPGKKTFRDILPIAGTCLIFQSRRLWHEVLPPRRLQFALTLHVHTKD